MKLLVNTPPLDRNGGVANFYRMLEPHFGPEVEFFTVAETVGGTSKKLFGAVADVFRYIRRLSRGGIDVCVFNPSLNRGAILRDAAYSFIAARLFRKPTAVFWHGWDLKYERKVQTSPLRRWRLRHSLFHAELMFVLAASFAERLKEWGYRGKVLTATTAIPAP